MTERVNLFTLRVLTERDSTYGYFVAHCLETGNVVTADDHDLVVDMMCEVLHDEVAYALKNKDFNNLFRSPAPANIWETWYEVTQKRKPIQRTVEVQTDDTRKLGEVLVSKKAAA